MVNREHAIGDAVTLTQVACIVVDRQFSSGTQRFSEPKNQLKFIRSQGGTVVNYDESQVSDVLVEGESIGRVAPHIEVQPLFPVSGIQPLGSMIQTSRAKIYQKTSLA